MWESLMREAFDGIAKGCDKDVLLSRLTLEGKRQAPDGDAS
jgi:hypothetical protein